MPLEIRELVIKVNIQTTATEQQCLTEEQLQEIRTALIRECTEAILSRLNSTAR